jgi:hypothetical protein
MNALEAMSSAVARVAEASIRRGTRVRLAGHETRIRNRAVRNCIPEEHHRQRFLEERTYRPATAVPIFKQSN